MHTRASSWTVLATALFVGGALLACKGKNKDSAPGPTAETPASAAAPTAPAAPEPSKTTFEVGETAKSSEYSLSVASVKECKPKYYFSKPKKGTTWLGAELIVEATTDKQIWSNASHAKLIDADGLTYNYTFASTKDCDPALSATQLSKSEKAKGWVVFEVPNKASGLKLTYNPSIVGTPQQVKFDLGSLPLAAAKDTAAVKPAAVGSPVKSQPAKTAPTAETAKTEGL